MSKNKDIGQYRHLAFAAVGGFFAGYAILCRSGLLANAQTNTILVYYTRPESTTAKKTGRAGNACRFSPIRF